MRFELYPELCCEICNVTIHNHFDCPACGEVYAGTSIYGDLDDCDLELSCEECGATWERDKGSNDWRLKGGRR